MHHACHIAYDFLNLNTKGNKCMQNAPTSNLSVGINKHCMRQTLTLHLWRKQALQKKKQSAVVQTTQSRQTNMVCMKKMITTIYCGANNSLFLRPNMRLGQWKCNHFHHTQIHPYLYFPPTMEIYQQKTTTDNVMVCVNKRPRENIHHARLSYNMSNHS